MAVDASVVDIIIHRSHLPTVQKGQAGQSELEFY